ncbi:hypothetical protein HCN44_003959 [Aphidius gifuensis]|uniref:Uncharacterized protein n=1 Tax=Aphidius gifuensis TaxID=684658 RepID=A0A835CSM9_APHGI|nr:hypothetical protein HCN44_003959 [Aphidius gifuensis]
MPDQLNRSNNRKVDCRNDESSKGLIDKAVPEIKPKDRISSRIRVIITQLGTIILFLISTLFVKINTDEWQYLFLGITLITAAGINAVSSILAGTMFAIVGHFPPKYITSFSQGLSSSGIFSAILQILSLWLSTGPIATGFMYFLIGFFIFLSSFFSYIFLEKQKFFKYYIKNKPVIKKSVYSGDDTTSSAENNPVSYVKIFLKIWPYGLSMFITFSATYSVFPAINTLVKSEAPSKTEWYSA